MFEDTFDLDSLDVDDFVEHYDDSADYEHFGELDDKDLKDLEAE